jgi:hypothetical protein
MKTLLASVALLLVQTNTSFSQKSWSISGGASVNPTKAYPEFSLERSRAKSSFAVYIGAGLLKNIHSSPDPSGLSKQSSLYTGFIGGFMYKRFVAPVTHLQTPGGVYFGTGMSTASVNKTVHLVGKESSQQGVYTLEGPQLGHFNVVSADLLVGFQKRIPSTRMLLNIYAMASFYYPYTPAYLVHPDPFFGTSYSLHLSLSYVLERVRKVKFCP